MFAHDHVDLFPRDSEWPRPNHVNEHARKRDNSTNDFSRNNLLRPYPLGEPEKSCDPRNKIGPIFLLLDNLLEHNVCILVSACLGRSSSWCLSPRAKRTRKKKEPWLVMASTSKWVSHPPGTASNLEPARYGEKVVGCRTVSLAVKKKVLLIARVPWACGWSVSHV